MTCIVGIEHNNKVYIGGDSYACGPNGNYEVANPKVFKNGDFIFGYTTSFRFGQILQFIDLPIPPKKEKDYFKFFVTEVSPEIQKSLDSGMDNGRCLIGLGSHLYVHQGDGSVLRSSRGYGSVGCGEDFANTSMETQLRILKDKKPKNIIKTALEVTSIHCKNVGGKITIINT